MEVVLLSTYDMGRQPFGLASPAAWLRAAGHEVHCVDLTRTQLSEETVKNARARRVLSADAHGDAAGARRHGSRARAESRRPHLRLRAVRAAQRRDSPRARRADHPRARVRGTICWASQIAFRPKGGNYTRARGKIGAAEEPLGRASPSSPPDRSDLPPLTRYASLQVGDARKVVGYTEATRGCKHRCRHCPIVPVYDGRFRAVPIDVVLADIRAQVAAGAQHITFGDPDFFNGPTHALAIVDARGARVPRRHLRRHDQGRAPAAAGRGAAAAARHRLRVRHLRRRIVRRRGARAAGEGTHPRRLRRGRRRLPVDRPRAVADLRRVHAVDDARRVCRPAARDRAPRPGAGDRADSVRDPAA